MTLPIRIVSIIFIYSYKYNSCFSGYHKKIDHSLDITSAKDHEHGQLQFTTANK